MKTVYQSPSKNLFHSPFRFPFQIRPLLLLLFAIQIIWGCKKDGEDVSPETREKLIAKTWSIQNYELVSIANGNSLVIYNRAGTKNLLDASSLRMIVNSDGTAVTQLDFQKVTSTWVLKNNGAQFELTNSDGSKNLYTINRLTSSALDFGYEIAPNSQNDGDLALLKLSKDYSYDISKGLKVVYNWNAL